jgi:hypothetical protein
MNKTYRTFLGLFALSVGYPASAAEFELLRSSPQIAFPNTGPRGQFDYKVGDTILTVPLLWARAATLDAPVTIKADTETITLEKNTVLPAAIIGPKAGTVVLAFCTPRKAAERKAEKGGLGILLGGGSLWRSMIRSATDKQFCLIDADRDNKAEQSVMINAGSPQARSPVNITPVPLLVGENVPISPKDNLSIRFADTVAKGKFPTLELNILQQGETRQFDGFSGSWGSSNRVTTIGDKKTSWPITTKISAADFTVLGLDPITKILRIEWPAQVDEKQVVVVPDGLAVVMTR